jgi:hypothetical protein
MTVIVIWGAIAIASGVLAAVLAGIKNRDYSFWIAWSFLVPPVVLWLLMMPKRSGPRPRQPPLDTLDRHDSIH